MSSEDAPGQPPPGGRGRALVQLLRVFKDGKTFEMRWTHLPPGHRALSEVRRTNDLVLRYFHQPVDLTALDFEPEADAEVLLRRALQVPPVDNGDERQIRVWLSVRSPELAADVMLGDSRVGSATLPQRASEELIAEASRGVYADGLLVLSPGPGPDVPVVSDLRCYLPRE